MSRAITGPGMAISRAAVQHSGLREAAEGARLGGTPLSPPARGREIRRGRAAPAGPCPFILSLSKEHGGGHRPFLPGRGRGTMLLHGGGAQASGPTPTKKLPTGQGGSRSETEGGSAKTAATAAARDRALATQPPSDPPAPGHLPRGGDSKAVFSRTYAPEPRLRLTRRFCFTASCPSGLTSAS